MNFKQLPDLSLGSTIKIFILRTNYRSTLPSATLPRLRAVAWGGYVNSINEPTLRNNRMLLEKMTTLDKTVLRI